MGAALRLRGGQGGAGEVVPSDEERKVTVVSSSEKLIESGAEHPGRGKVAMSSNVMADGARVGVYAC